MNKTYSPIAGGADGLAVVGLAVVGMIAVGLVSCSSAPKGEAKPDAVSGVSMVDTGMGSVLDQLNPVQDGKRTLVVYFTTGNAAVRVAEDLAEMFSADLELIVEEKPRKWGFMSGGFAATTGQAPPIVGSRFDPSAYGRVFVVSPVWAWRMAPPIRSWLRRYKGKLPEAAYGTVSGDTEPKKIVAAMAKEGGREPFAYAGFSEKDFLAENRKIYLEKLRTLAGLKQ